MGRKIIESTLVILVVAFGTLVAQNTTQVLPTDAQRAAYWRAMYEMRDATCTADKAVDRGTKVIQGFCPAGSMISTATPGTATTPPGEPTCVSIPQ